MAECRGLLARWWALSIAVAVVAGVSLGCGGGSDGGDHHGGGTVVEVKPGDPGNPDGHCTIPTGAWLEDSSSPRTVVGTGTPESCTGDAFIAAVAKGGVITFNCGADPATIRLSRPAKIVNDTGPKIVIDGGGKVTLSGEGVTRILYMNTCDESLVWLTSHCQDQDSPQLTLQNLTFANGNSKNVPATSSVGTNLDGGGAIWARGGRLKVVNSRFMNNVCADAGSDVGGGAIRVFDQYQDLPVYVVNSTFGGAEGMGNTGASGGALSSIGVSWTVLNSIISYNRAVGAGGNDGTGGSGGGIYNDGNTMTLSLCGTRMEHNFANAFGRALFFVSNNGTGTVAIQQSTITGNTGSTNWERVPQISMDADSRLSVSADSVIHN